MSNSKISALTSATTVAGTEVLPIVQSSATVKLAISDLNPGLSTILASKGGTGLISYAAGDIVYYASGTALSKLAIGAANTVLTSSGTAPQWSTNLNIGSLTATSISNSGNLTFTSTGNRVTGDFSNATIANRVMFQTSTVNGVTTVEVIPNGTSLGSGLVVSNSSSSPANCSFGSMTMPGAGTDFRIQSSLRGTGTYLPMTFYAGGSQRLTIDTSGNTLVTSAAGLGYGTGSGGTVTQATSKSTAVTLNKPTGQITMNNALLLTNTAVAFQVNNTLISATDTVVVSIQDSVTSNTNYQASVSQVVAGAFVICLQNISTSSLSETVVINFATIKGATS